MTRELTDHRINPANDVLKIVVTDDTNHGAHHRYAITGMGLSAFGNPSRLQGDPAEAFAILFQHGPIGEVGVNGITHEALLAVLIDRLRSFQDGPFRCRENAIALTHLEDALHWLHHRTRARQARGVEGTHNV